MKRLLCLFCFIKLMACNNKESTTGNLINSTMVLPDPNAFKIEQAKALIDQLDSFARLSVAGKIKRPKSNQMIRSIMDNYFNIVKTLPPVDTLELNNYRLNKINRLVNPSTNQTLKGLYEAPSAKTQAGKIKNYRSYRVSTPRTDTYKPVRKRRNTNTRIIYIGPRGGRYYINSNGNKTYI